MPDKYRGFTGSFIRRYFNDRFIDISDDLLTGGEVQRSDGKVVRYIRKSPQGAGSMICCPYKCRQIFDYLTAAFTSSRQSFPLFCFSSFPVPVFPCCSYPLFLRLP